MDDFIDPRYKVIKELGSGGMGAIYLASDEKLGRKVAIKVVHKHLLVNESVLERLKKEARATASLSYENIVSLYDISQSEPPYLVMEYIPGRTLEDFLEEHKILPSLAVMEMTRQLCGGLAAAHEKGLIHRDIKPSNILLDNQGCLKITDFGLVHVLNQDSLTASGLLLGTPQYVSPEIIKMNRITPRADIFSLGCMLYRSTTGIPPFKGDNPHQTMQQILKKELEPPQNANPTLLPLLNTLIVKSLCKVPEKRPTASEIVQAIEEYTMENRLKMGKPRLRALLESPADYIEKEESELHSHYLSLAEFQRARGKTAEAHRNLSRANLIKKNAGNKIIIQKKNSGLKKPFSIAVATLLFTILLLLIFLRETSKNGRLVKRETFQPQPGNSRAESVEVPEKPDSTGIAAVKKSDSIAPDSKMQINKIPRHKKAKSKVEKTKVRRPTYHSKNHGFFLLKTKPPFASIFIDGKFMGSTPLKKPLFLKAGARKLKVEKRGCQTISKNIRIIKEDTLSIALELPLQ